ncbi:MAG: phage holin family protein, partial [Pseudomonadota bacterium]
GIVLLAVFFVVLFWDSYRLAVLGVMAGFFLGMGIFAVLALRAKAAENTKMFSATLAELAKDREQLK